MLLRARPDVAAQVPAAPFIALLKSGTWPDHNKAVLVLDALTATRAPAVLAELRSRAADSGQVDPIPRALGL